MNSIMAWKAVPSRASLHAVLLMNILLKLRAYANTPPSFAALTQGHEVAATTVSQTHTIRPDRVCARSPNQFKSGFSAFSPKTKPSSCSFHHRLVARHVSILPLQQLFDKPASRTSMRRSRPWFLLATYTPSLSRTEYPGSLTDQSLNQGIFALHNGLSSPPVVPTFSVTPTTLTVL